MHLFSWKKTISFFQKKTILVGNNVISHLLGCPFVLYSLSLFLWPVLSHGLFQKDVNVKRGSGSNSTRQLRKAQQWQWQWADTIMGGPRLLMANHKWNHFQNTIMVNVVEQVKVKTWSWMRERVAGFEYSLTCCY